MITTRKRSRRKFDCLLRHSIPEGVAWRQIIAKNRDRLRVDHYRAALLDLWEGNERSERRRRRPRSLDRKEEVTRGLEGGEVGEGTLEGRGIKRGKKEIHNTRVTNYSWAHPGSSWLQRGSHENVLWAGRVVVFRPISLSLFLFLLRACEKKRREGKEYIHRFPGLTANPARKNPNASNSPRNTRTKLPPTPTQFSLFFQIISILGFAINLDSWFVEVLVGGWLIRG